MRPDRFWCQSRDHDAERGTQARLAAVVAILACFGATPGFALVPGDLCTGNPCVIGSNVVITASAILDFGPTTALQFAPGISVLLQNGATPQFRAGSITIGSGDLFTSDAPGSSLYFFADATGIDVASSGPLPARFVLRDAGELGFFSEGDTTMTARVDVSGKTVEAGTFYIQSGANITFTGVVLGDASTGSEFATAGTVDFDASGALSVDARVRAKGKGADSGRVLMRGRSVAARGSIDVKPTVGFGGTVEITARAGDVTFASKTNASGRKAPDDTDGSFCDGGSVVLQATGSIRLEKQVSVASGGSGGCSAGTFSAQAGADFVQLRLAGIRADSGSLGAGGSVQIQATGNAVLGGIDVGSGDAGSIVAAAGGSLDAAGPIQARSKGSAAGTDGSITLSGACGLHVPARARLIAAQQATTGGRIDLTSSGGPMTIDGMVKASSTVDLHYVTGFAPIIGPTGRVTPAPNLIEVPTGTCGS